MKCFGCLWALLWGASCAWGVDIFVSPAGNDAHAGTEEFPVHSVEAALRKAGKEAPGKNSRIILGDGIYHLREPLVLRPEHSGLTICARHPNKAVLSGAVPFSTDWKPFRDGVMKTPVPAGLEMDVLLVNGKPMRMARYPNYDPEARIFNGTSADADSPRRAALWKNPSGGFLHALHARMWGDMHFRITGKKGNNLVKEGGWQNNRPSPPHERYKFVENIFEELDAPGEWYLDRRENMLYLYPEPGTDLSRAVVEAAGLAELVRIQGEEGAPVKNVALRDLVLTGTRRTFMENREPLLRSDWTIFRSGAVLLRNTENCRILSCEFLHLGGNAVFVDGKNDRALIRACHIHEVGGNGVALVGDRSAYRGPRDYAEARGMSLEKLDRKPGPANGKFPSNCLVDDCLIWRTGLVEKQTAGVEISLAQNITVRNCSIYEVPRAGINIGEGAFGGHVVEYCDVFDTVRETSDHGSFNSWGRDRFWVRDQTALSQDRDVVLLDCLQPNILRNNRWRCDHGWDVDLDDGSSNYVICNNVMLSSGLKLREGFFRKVYNNILVNNTLHPHVWFRESGDEFYNNIVFEDRYCQAGNMDFSPWGKNMDRNFVHVEGMKNPEKASGLAGQSGNDRCSMKGDALLVNPGKGDYSVRSSSPALKLGFRNFPMDRFGVRSAHLKALSRTPDIPGTAGNSREKGGVVPAAVQVRKLGAEVRVAEGEGDLSVFGLMPEDLGCALVVVKVQKGGPCSSAGIQPNDVLLKVNGNKVCGVKSLKRLLPPSGKLNVTIRRNQENKKLSMQL